MKCRKRKKAKGPYEKPKLRAINLLAGEVLAVGCKTSFGDPSGVGGNGCLTGICSATLGS
jgi:hypothetical protein